MKKNDEENCSLCIYCKKNIAIGATLCSECGSIQRPWKNELKYWSGVIGFFTVLASGAIFMLNFGTKTINHLLIPKIIVTDIDSISKSTLWNSSENRVFINGIEVSTTDDDNKASTTGNDNVELYWNISSFVEPGKTLDFYLSDLSKKQMQGRLRTLYSTDCIDNHVNWCDKQDFNSLRKSGEFKYEYMINFLYKNGQTYKFLSGKERSSLCHIPCKMKLIFTINTGSEITMKIPCVGIATFIKEECYDRKQ